MANLFSDLQRCLNSEQYADGLNICQQILEQQSNSEAQHARIFCMLNLSKWQEILDVVADSPDFVNEKAYALYRLNRLEDAARILQHLPDSPFTDRLSVQVSYRLNDFDHCIDVYKRMRQEDPDDSGVTANYLASVVSGDASLDLASIAAGEDTLEVNFNLACGYINAGLLDQAVETLESAQKTLEGDLLGEDEDLDLEQVPEIAILGAQLGVVWQRQGKVDEAMDAYNRVLKLSVGGEVGEAARDVATKNLALLKAAKNLDSRLVRKKECAKKRKKKIRYPKNYDPENPGPMPDPERWLPKYERTEYKKRMAKKTKGLMRGPQGAMPSDDMAFRNKGPTTAQAEVAGSEVRRKKKGRR